MSDLASVDLGDSDDDASVQIVTKRRPSRPIPVSVASSRSRSRSRASSHHSRSRSPVLRQLRHERAQLADVHESDDESDDESAHALVKAYAAQAYVTKGLLQQTVAQNFVWLLSKVETTDDDRELKSTTRSGNMPPGANLRHAVAPTLDLDQDWLGQVPLARWLHTRNDSVQYKVLTVLVLARYEQSVSLERIRAAVSRIYANRAPTEAQLSTMDLVDGLLEWSDDTHNEIQLPDNIFAVRDTLRMAVTLGGIH
jgi:hypothetical protein